MGIEGKAGVRNLIVGLYQATPMTLSDGELGPCQLTSDGKLIVETSVDSSWGTLVRTPINFTAAGAGTTEIVAAGDACQYVVACMIMTDTQVGIRLNSDTVATPLTGIMPISQRSGFILTPWKGTTGGWLKGDSGENLTVTVDAACDVDGFIVTRDSA